MFKRLQDLVDGLNESNSTLEKKEKLRNIDIGIKNILYWIYNPFLQYNITSKNIIKNSEIIKENNLSILELLKILNTREATGHEAIGLVNGFINNNIEYKELILNIIDKDLKCRVGVSIINDVFPDFIPTFDVALANSYNDVSHRIDIFDGNWLASHKLDGCLSADTIVELKNNGKKTIKEVVDRKLVDDIKCYDEANGKVVYSQIDGWGVDIELKEDVNWFEIELENGGKIKATSNHPFFLPDIKAYRRADKLSVGDYLLVDL